MKTMLCAMALVLAAPVGAQSAPAADPHAAHKQGMPHGKHDQKHDMACCKMPCCDKMKQKAAGEKKGCCAEGGKSTSGGEAKPHSGH